MSKNQLKQTRREFLKGTGALAAGIALSGRISNVLASEKWRKPNVIFVFADQLRACSVGCYGDKQAKTPNIDKLASKGVRFTNAISTWASMFAVQGNVDDWAISNVKWRGIQRLSNLGWFAIYRHCIQITGLCDRLHWQMASSG